MAQSQSSVTLLSHFRHARFAAPTSSSSSGSARASLLAQQHHHQDLEAQRAAPPQMAPILKNTVREDERSSTTVMADPVVAVEDDVFRAPNKRHQGERKVQLPPAVCALESSKRVIFCARAVIHFGKLTHVG